MAATAQSLQPCQPRPSFLGLPLEIRREIYLLLFRSTIVYVRRYSRDEDLEPPLSILRVCRQIYNEASPLVLRNVRVYCEGNVQMMNALSNMSPAQISQLRHLIIAHCPVGFKLFRAGEGTQEATTGAEHERDGNSDVADDHLDAASDEFDDGIRYFHLGELLTLFPGLQLDLLEVFNGTGGSPYTGLQTTECFSSLLEADGFRRLWMESTSGDSDAWVDSPSVTRWKEIIANRFRPYANWSVQIRLESYEWPFKRHSDYWKGAQDAGITLLEKSQNANNEYSGHVGEDGHNGEDDVDIIVDRGNADFAVKQGEDRLLRCIGLNEDREESPSSYQRCSDALKKLFKNYSWEAIKALDGFDDGTVDSWDGGDIAYSKRL